MRISLILLSWSRASAMPLALRLLACCEGGHAHCLHAWWRQGLHSRAADMAAGARCASLCGQRLAVLQAPADLFWNKGAV